MDSSKQAEDKPNEESKSDYKDKEDDKSSFQNKLKVFHHKLRIFRAIKKR